MPWLHCLLVLSALADPALLTDKWSGCGEVTTDDEPPLFFSPCATSEWEVLLTDTVVNHQKQRNATALLRLPQSGNLKGCSQHPSAYFENRIALIERGSCYFSWKVVLAEAAGALAVLIFDTVAQQSTAVLAISGPFPNPRIAAYLISRDKGQELAARVELGADVQVVCSWNPIEVWFGLPNTSSEFNDTLMLENYGDEEMRWVLDVIDHNRSFATDPFYTAQVLTTVDVELHSETFEALDLKSFNGSVQSDDEAELLSLPFVFPYYLHFYDKAYVSCNGALIFDPVLDEFTRQAAVLGSGIGPHAVLAAMWGDLLCPEGSRIFARKAPDLTSVRFEGLLQKNHLNDGNLTFEVRLHRDGRVLLLLEGFPMNLTTMSELQVGLQPATGARALSVGETLPWSDGPPLGVSFTPWLRLEDVPSYAVAPNESIRLGLTFERQEDLYGWLFLYAERSIGSWYPRRNVRFTQRIFRYFWVLSAWDGGMHSGTCIDGFVRRRSRTCSGSDGQVYDDSFCIGSCMDKDPLVNFDYPEKLTWKDGYNNQCEDYRVLDLCREDGSHGSKWQSWWGTFNDWVTAGLDAAAACCLCGGGTSSPSLPHVEESCPSVTCPANSYGSNVLSGCKCLPGYQGQINRSEDYPYFSGACWPVACPIHSTGTVPSGCTCDYGYIGNITATDVEPFYVGSCQETTTGTTSTRTSSTSSVSSTTSSMSSTTSTSKSSTTSTFTTSTFTTQTSSSTSMTTSTSSSFTRTSSTRSSSTETLTSTLTNSSTSSTRSSSWTSTTHFSSSSTVSSTGTVSSTRTISSTQTISLTFTSSSTTSGWPKTIQTTLSDTSTAETSTSSSSETMTSPMNTSTSVPTTFAESNTSELVSNTSTSQTQSQSSAESTSAPEILIDNASDDNFSTDSNLSWEEDTNASGVLRQANFAGIEDLETSSASFLFFLFLMLLLWVAAMCGGIVYFLSKSRRCRRSRHATKVEPAEEVAKVLRGWSEGDLSVRKEGEDLLQKLQKLWADRPGKAFRDVLPDPECHPSSFESKVRDLFQDWRQERRSDAKDTSSVTKKILRMADVAEQIALRSEAEGFPTLRNSIEEEWLILSRSQSKELQDPTDSAATTALMRRSSSSICSVNPVAGIFAEQVLELYKDELHKNAKLWSSLGTSKVAHVIADWSRSSKLLDELSDDGRKQLLQDLQEVLSNQLRSDRDPSYLLPELNRLWERADAQKKIQEAIPELELPVLVKESLSSSRGAVSSCGEDLLRQLQQRWQDMGITSSNVYADLQTFCTAWREEKLIEQPDVDDALLRRLVGELSEVVSKVGAGKGRVKIITLFPEIQEEWHLRLDMAEDDAVWEDSIVKARALKSEKRDLGDVVEEGDPVLKSVPARPELEAMPAMPVSSDQDVKQIAMEQLDPGKPAEELEDVEDDESVVPMKTKPSSQPELEDVGDEESVVLMKTRRSGQPELEDMDEEQIIPMQTKQSSLQELEDVDEDQIVPMQTKPSSQPELEDVVEERHDGFGSVAWNAKPDLAEFTADQTCAEAPAPNPESTEIQAPESLDACLHLLLVDELVEVFSSHQWNCQQAELGTLRSTWHRKNILAAEGTSCAVEACMKLRNRPDVVPPAPEATWTQDAELLTSGEDFLQRLLRAKDVEQVVELCEQWCQCDARDPKRWAMATEAQRLLLAKELLTLSTADVQTALRNLWRDILEAEPMASSEDRDVLAQSMQEWNDLSKVMMDDVNEVPAVQVEGVERSECEEGQSSEWLQGSEALSQASFADDEMVQWKAAAVAYGSLVDDVLEICDDPQPDMSVQVVSLVEGWQRKQAENQTKGDSAGSEEVQGMLQDMAETTRNLIKSQRQKKFTKASLRCLFEQAWEQKIQESTKDRTPWTNCEILYRRGEALLNNFAEIVKASRRQKMKGSHVKRELAQVADHWCHRTLAAAVGADVVSYKLLRDMALEAQRIFLAKVATNIGDTILSWQGVVQPDALWQIDEQHHQFFAYIQAKETAKSDGFTAATFLRTALPQTREAWRALLVDVQGNVCDDSWKQWLDSWETPSEVKSRENVERWKKSVNKIKGIGALLGKAGQERRPSQILQSLGNLNAPEGSESLRPSGSLRRSGSLKPTSSPSKSFQAFMPQGADQACDSSEAMGSGTASGSLIRQRRPSGAASSISDNWSPDYAGSGGRRESSIRQDRRDSQVLGEFRDIYARRESLTSEGSGTGSASLGLGLPISSSSAAYLAVPKRKSQRSQSAASQGSDFSFTSSASSARRMDEEFERLLPKSSPSRKESPSPYTSPFASQQASPRRSAATSSDQDRSADESSASRRGSRRKSRLGRAGSQLIKDG